MTTRIRTFLLWPISAAALLVLALILLNPVGSSDPPPSTSPDDTTDRSSLDEASAPWQDLSSTERVEGTLPSSTAEGAEDLAKTEQPLLETAFSEAQHAIRPISGHLRKIPDNQDALYLASNPANKISARFLDKCVRFHSDHAGRDWQGVLGMDTDSEVDEIRQEGTRIEYHRESVVEWFDNRPDGIEHGYYIEQKTAAITGGDGLRVPVKLAGLSVRADHHGGLNFHNAEGKAVLAYNKLQVWDANGLELSAAMVPTSVGLDILVADAGAAYPIMIDPLITSLEEDDSDALAFPGAEGFGRFTLGGRGGIVLHVTDLGDASTGQLYDALGAPVASVENASYGEGTLRWALQGVSGPRYVVFDIG
jgi:hypothetical protein